MRPGTQSKCCSNFSYLIIIVLTNSICRMGIIIAPYFIKLLLGLNELIRIKCSAQWWVHGRHTTNVVCLPPPFVGSMTLSRVFLSFSFHVFKIRLLYPTVVLWQGLNEILYIKTLSRVPTIKAFNKYSI